MFLLLVSVGFRPKRLRVARVNVWYPASEEAAIIGLLQKLNETRLRRAR